MSAESEETSPFLLKLMKEFNELYDNSDAVHTPNDHQQYEMSIVNDDKVKITRKTVDERGSETKTEVSSKDISNWLTHAKRNLGGASTLAEDSSALEPTPKTISTITKGENGKYSDAAMQKLVANFATVGNVQFADAQKAAMLAKRLQLLVPLTTDGKAQSIPQPLLQALTQCMVNEEDRVTTQNGLSLSPPERTILSRYASAIRTALSDIVGGDAQVEEVNGKALIPEAALAKAWDTVVNTTKDANGLLGAMEPTLVSGRGRG